MVLGVESTGGNCNSVLDQTKSPTQTKLDKLILSILLINKSAQITASQPEKLGKFISNLVRVSLPFFPQASVL